MTESVANNESEQCLPRTGVDLFLSETTPIGRLYITSEGFCEMPSTPSTPSGTGNPLGFCSVEESTGGKGVSPGLD